MQVYVNDSCGPNAFRPGQDAPGHDHNADERRHAGTSNSASSFPSTIPDGEFLSATATDPAGNTSEFSLDIVVGTLVVRNTNDDGAGSLREAINCSNMLPGTDTIAFDIPGTGVHTITPASALPMVTDPVIIDGYTQPGASPNTQSTGDDAVLLIELDGRNRRDRGLRVEPPRRQ